MIFLLWKVHSIILRHYLSVLNVKDKLRLGLLSQKVVKNMGYEQLIYLIKMEKDRLEAIVDENNRKRMKDYINGLETAYEVIMNE